jgi:hypothetical protein
MKTLFLLSATLFAIGALGWFFTWAIWIHAPKAWYGRPLSPLGAAERAPTPDHPAVRHLAWYRALKFTTVVLFVLSLGLLLAWHFSGV